MKTFFFTLIFFSSAIAHAQYKNVMISNFANPNETSTAINPKNTQHLVAGANINSYYYSFDGGSTWDFGFLNSPYGVWGDPCMMFDTTGSAYFFHLSNPPDGGTPGAWVDRIVCQRSDNGGITWNTGTYTGLNGTKVQDKHWTAVDPRNNIIHMTWTQFDAYNSFDKHDSSVILYSRSADKGETWTPPKRISAIAGDCIDNDNTVEGAVPAVGPNGEVYVAWAGPAGLVFQKSLDGGNTWLLKEKIVDSIPGGWTYDIPGIYRCNGLPVTLCDLSTGPDRGAIYINWSDQRNGTTDTDIWFVKSTNGGDTWSAPKRINDDSTRRHQFLTWMTIDQKNGNIYTVFYDRRNYSDMRTDVYLAVSKDGGESFKNVRISDSPFVPDADIFFGDYTNIAVSDNIVRPVWTRLHEGQLSMWTALIDSVDAKGYDIPTMTEFDQNYPNPFKDITYLSFKLHAESDISLTIYTILGEKVATLIDNKRYAVGKHIESFDAKSLSLAIGSYYAVLKSNGKEMKRKMIVIR